MAYDNPAALNRPLQQYLGHDYDLWQYELNMLYAVYSLPNMFLPFLGGQLVDRLDPKKVLLGFSLCVCLGQTLFAIGVNYKSFPIMVFGRVLFGIGGESISVVQSSITTSWFKKKELAFALGLTILAAVIAAHSPPVEDEPHQHSHFNSQTRSEDSTQPSTLYHSFESFTDIPAPPGSISSPITEATALLGGTKKETAYSRFVESVNSFFGEVKKFPFAFWLVCVICVLLYGTVVPFNTIASDFLMSKWYPGDTETAGVVMSIPDSMSAILVPICGAFVDRYGNRATLLIFCSLVIAGVHLTLGLTYLDPVLPLVCLGLSYSIYGVALWPSVATIIQHEEQVLWDAMPENSPMPKLLGSAYGFSTAALNTALTIMPLIAAQIRVVGGSFIPVEMFFVTLALGGAVSSLILAIMDRRNGSILEKPEAIYDSADEEQQDPQDANGGGGAGAANDESFSSSSERLIFTPPGSVLPSVDDRADASSTDPRLTIKSKGIGILAVKGKLLAAQEVASPLPQESPRSLG
ncbi:hypothetical protein HDU97_002273 [Phlyctochytrium planicorne]|nr:hypothetical protein HDU97_002273 [Phlyctochytrium planicorne]